MCPVKRTVCGLPPPLSLTEMSPKPPKLPVWFQVTVMAQDFPAPKLAAHVFVWEKGPVIVMPEISSSVFPTLVSVVFSGGLHTQERKGPNGPQTKPRLVGVSSTAVPVPLREAVCGLPDALSDTERIAVRVPIWDGLKVTLILQVAPEISEPAHVFVWPKSAMSVPLIPMPAIASESVP